ncbi:RsmD family RNA methyltransferase, partial [Elusimicrobiota bacterium]
HGKGSIRMKVGLLEMEVSAFSFCQPNSYQIANMYDIVCEAIDSDGTVLDLYSGIGSIALNVAGAGRHITGVENHAPSILDAQKNLLELDLPGKVDFIESSARNFMSSLKHTVDYVILDPPRGGMSYRIWKHLERINRDIGRIRRIVYICCSLRNLQDDLDYIRDYTDWNISSITGVDQFVHTPHLETIVVIEP